MTLADVADWGLQTGLVVSFLIGLVLIIRRPFARYLGAGAAYALWLLPALRLFMPTMTVPFLRRPAPENFETVNPASETLLYNIPSESMPALTVDPSTFAETSSHMSIPSIWAVIAVIWLSVAIIWFGFQLVRQRAFMAQMRANSAPVSDQLSSSIESAGEITGLRRLPTIRLSRGVSGPMVTGLTRPLILLPQDFEARFNPEQQIFALVHEMSHIRRGDLWVALIVLGFRALFWPNPLVHYAAQKMRIDQEAACDAAVVVKTGGGDAAHSYAQTLVHAAKTSTQSGQQSPLGLAFYESEPTEKFSKGDENDEMV
jgi:beta-lactamase regulating signal transducer with metallopeptidase domain